MRVELNRAELGALLEALDAYGDDITRTPPVVGDLGVFYAAVEKLRNANRPKARNQHVPLADRTVQDWLVCVRMTVALLEAAKLPETEPEHRLMVTLRRALTSYDQGTSVSRTT